ncbi:ATP-binding protein [Hymenobacter polaris]|nr:ATP-binding protein [Hymenobacter polaris]
MRVLLLKTRLALLLALGCCLAAQAQAPAPEPPFTLACRSGSRVGGDKQQFCEVRDLTMPAPTGEPLLISGANGGTTVRGWDGPAVRIKALVQSGGGTEAEAQARVQAVGITAAGNALRTALPSQEGEYLVRYEVFVPRQTALVVTSAGGNLRFENLQGRLAFQGGNGNAYLGSLGGQVTGSLSNGNLIVALTGRTWTGEGLDVRTANGDISWRMPAGYSARLLMNTTNGRFYTGLPVVRMGSMQQVDATVGEGGALLKATTVNGAITFRSEDGGTLFTRSAEAVSPVQPITNLKRALAKSSLTNPAAADSLLTQARQLNYAAGQVVALSQLAAAQQPVQPAQAAAHLQEATQLAAQLRDVADASWALGRVGQQQSQLARRSSELADFYAPLMQALGNAMNAGAAFQEAPFRETAGASALGSSERRQLRSLAQAFGSLPAGMAAAPGLPLGRLPLPGFGLANKLLDTLLAGRPATPQAARELRAARKQLDRSQALSTAFAKEGDYAKAYQYYVQYTAYKDSLTAEATTRRLAALEYRQNLLRKEAQIQRLTKERLLREQGARRQQQFVLGLGALVAVLGLVAFVLSRSNRARRRANAQLNEQKETLQTALADLQTAQNQLVQSEKMASLGELTAGIAHEIQNPLNFVNNFSEVSAELVDELLEHRQQPSPDPALEAELLTDVRQNLHKISQHGHRASAIVRGMLEHARTSTGQKEPTDLNALLQEYGQLAYHSARAKDKAFQAHLALALDPQLGSVAVVPQDVSRVLLNIFTNAFYAVQQKSRMAGPDYQPEVQVRTQRTAGQVCLQIRDNGLGIPEAIRQKIFQPFFTTKPTGEGTGLGLSLSYDIITKGHGGTLGLDSVEREYTEFTITLPAAG